MVILITGRPGSGKTTHARHLAVEYGQAGLPAIVLDGDEIRSSESNLDFSYEGRKAHLKNMANLASMAERREIVAIVSVVSPLREFREMMRSCWNKSRLVYLPGGWLWEGTGYEQPIWDEFNVYSNR